MKEIDLEIYGPHVFIELDAKIKAELVELFGRCKPWRLIKETDQYYLRTVSLL